MRLSHAHDMLNIPSFLINFSSPSLKFTIFLQLSPVGHVPPRTQKIWPTLATSLPVAHWLKHPTGVRKVMGSIPLGDSDLSLFHAGDMLNIQHVKTSSKTNEKLCSFGNGTKHSTVGTKLHVILK